MNDDPLSALIALMARLRDPEHGCPWDRAQTFASIAPYTIEEGYEVADAIDRGDFGALRDELGDLLFQVLFHARMAEEQGIFSFHDVARTLHDKMVRRHPHVFASEGNASMHPTWEQHKLHEKRDAGDSLLDGVAHNLPALRRATKLQRRAAAAGFDWDDVEGVLAKLDEERAELVEARAGGDALAVRAELGDVLFTVVNLSRHLGVDAETALREASQRFERRFRAIEGHLAAAGRRVADTGADELDRLWQQVKADR